MATNGNKTTNPPNAKATPIPVVPRTLRIVNPDGTVTRSGQLLLEQIQQIAAAAGGPPTPGGAAGDATGPVTGFSSVGEVGTRYTGPDRLVYMTVGFVPIVPTPQSVTYLISSDNGATWVWIGSQRMLNAGQQLKVARLAPGQTQTWRVAAVAGNIGGDPTPLPDAQLDTLYPGVVRSGPFPVAGLTTPPTTQGITATIGAQYNIISADGFTQYGGIPALTYTDPTSSLDFFVRFTVYALDSTHTALEAEHPYGGTQITGPGDTHTISALIFPYGPGIAYMRYKCYTANRNSQGPGDFADPTTNTLQMVSWNGGTPVDHYDVPITIPPFTPIATEDVFSVTSVTASEVGPHYQDTNQGLHTTVGIIPVLSVDFSKPRTVTIWLDFGNGVPVWQGWYAMTSAGQVIRIGDSTLGTGGVRKAGDIWVPVDTAEGNWVVYCGPNQINSGINPTVYATYHFVVPPASACSPTGTTNAQFLSNPQTNNPIDYALVNPGIYHWEYYALTWTPPSLATEPDYWFTLATIQKGATISGTWTPAPDQEGANVDPTLKFLGRELVEVTQLPGLSSTQTAVITKYGAQPASWGIPPLQNPDGTTNLYRDFRFLLYNVSRLGVDTSGSGGAGTYTLQTTCWPGGADHFILTPQPQTAALDIRAANPASISLPLTGGNGQPLGIPAGGIGNTYLGPQSVHAVNMAASAVTAANSALAAGAVVDLNVHDVAINKVTYGTSVFAGDVVLSRGPNLPVIVLQSGGIYLYGQADGSGGTSGLTSKPYVAIQNNAIGLFQGGASGGSVYLDAVANAITIYSQNGNTSLPYFTVSSSGLSLVDGPYNVSISSTAVALNDTSTAGVTRQLYLNSTGINITNANNTIVITASAIQLQIGGNPRVTIDNTPSITLSNGGSASVVIGVSSVNVTFSSGGTAVNISPSISTPSGTISGFSVNTSTSWVTITSSAIEITDQNGISGNNYATMSRTAFTVDAGPLNQSQLTATSFQMTGLPSSSPGAGTKQFYYDPATGLVHFAA